jgi:hypothetical protein
MRTTVLLLSGLLLSGLAAAQETPLEALSRKKVTITRTWTDEGGREQRVTIIKEGAAAEELDAWFEAEEAEIPAGASSSREVEIRVFEDRVGEDPGPQAPWETLSVDIRRGMPDVERYLRDAGVELQELGVSLNRAMSGPAFLGVVTEPGADGALITEVVEGSAAEQAGLQPGDLLTRIDGHAVRRQQDLSRVLGRLRPGDQVSVHYRRDQEERTAEVTLGQRRPARTAQRALPGEMNDRVLLFRERPAKAPDDRAWLGIRMAEHRDGVRISEVMRNTAARAVGLQPGDLLYRIDRKSVASPEDVSIALKDRKEGERVTLHIRRDGRKMEVPVVLGSRDGCCLPADCPPGCCEEMGESARPTPGDSGKTIIGDDSETLHLPDLRIYPNPTGGVVRVAFRMPSEEGFAVRILDPQGKTVMVQELRGVDRFDEEIDLQAYPSGNYTLFIQQDGRFLTRTIIRNR